MDEETLASRALTTMKTTMTMVQLALMALSLESKGVTKSESIGRKNKEERARNLFDMSAEKIQPKRDIDSKVDS